MKALQWILSFLVVAALPLGSSWAAPQGDAPKQAPKAAPAQEQKLSIKPKSLSVIEVQGAKLYISSAPSALRVFLVEGPLVDNPKVDAQGLYNKAKACLAGQGCGRVLTTQERSAFYLMIEASSWFEALLAGRLAGVGYAGSTTMVFTDARAVVTADIAQIFARGGVCSPGGGGSQPQCPPGPLPPRDLWTLNVVLRGWSLPVGVARP